MHTGDCYATWKSTYAPGCNPKSRVLTDDDFSAIYRSQVLANSMMHSWTLVYRLSLQARHVYLSIKTVLKIPWTIHSPLFFCKIVRIERYGYGRPSCFHLYRGERTSGFIAILVSSKTVPRPLSRFHTLLQARLGTFETKLAARTGKSPISTMLLKNRGLWTVWKTLRIKWTKSSCKQPFFRELKQRRFWPMDVNRN